MPKIVDHQLRKEQLAEAAWRVIRREGLEGLSVRRVADEAGMSLGSLRHYFETQAELLAFSMRLVSQRARRRIENLPFTGDVRRDIEMIIAQLLPLDEERLAEGELWLAYAGKALSDPAIRAMSLEVHDELYQGFRRMVEGMVASKLAQAGIDAESETKALHALVDGLVVHCTVFPERVRAEELMNIVSYHLDRIFER
ncbi:TetR family transcriptional regulator [Cohnella sp. CFH 77786]|uniref:TetR/AcrR family transcriptional regulator n=1 Tax=Cohnella sp. CFH 77786 TaxID=2662265 RepID=UPI001C60DE61|nr:TetR/AcrR family transcriptional regulator [Cohnella sp. CFH 77786]MBW5448868.1 TetR family transcriptional regulator [Cohnella sp. CFH 77786]